VFMHEILVSTPSPFRIGSETAIESKH
jgi:hypothetical protein